MSDLVAVAVAGRWNRGTTVNKVSVLIPSESISPPSITGVIKALKSASVVM